MAQDSSAQDRHLPATERRITKARREGQVARSRDLAHLGVVGAGVAALAIGAPDISAWMARVLAAGLSFDAQTLLNPVAMQEQVASLGWQGLLLLAPLGLLSVAIALGTGVLAGGWNFTWQPLAPNFSKLNPISGLGRLFSMQQLSETLKACLLALLLAVVAALVLRQQWREHVALLAQPLPAALAAGGALLQTGLLLLCAVLAAFALIDVPLQRQLLLRRLRMSVQDVKNETKEQEGSPEIKQRVRQRMRELGRRRMLAAVPLADLVVLNPTHYAVALKYDEQKMAAPRVVAKGSDLLALRIRDLARESKVPVLQAPSLARALYAHTEVDHEVPARLFAAVAQVLAWVYGLRAAVAAGRAHTVDAPAPDVPVDLDPQHAALLSQQAASSRLEPEL
jgi:flagellar biosynthesis protein FlhB